MLTIAQGSRLSDSWDYSCIQWFGLKVLIQTSKSPTIAARTRNPRMTAAAAVQFPLKCSRGPPAFFPKATKMRAERHRKVKHQNPIVHLCIWGGVPMAVGSTNATWYGRCRGASGTKPWKFPSTRFPFPLLAYASDAWILDGFFRLLSLLRKIACFDENDPRLLSERPNRFVAF